MSLVLQTDSDADSCYVGFGTRAFLPASVAKSTRVTDDITLDFDADGRLVGLDIMNASKVLDLDTSHLGADLLVGVKEGAAMAGVRPSNFVRDYADRPGFPDPIAELAIGRVWLRSQVDGYLQTRPSSRRIRRAV